MTHPFTDKAAEEFRMVENSVVRTINDARTGDTVLLNGEPWLVIGFIDDPAVILERQGKRAERSAGECLPINERTHHTVCLGSPHALEFKLVERDRPMDLAREFCGGPFDDPHSDQDYRMALFASRLLTEKGAKL